MSREITKEKFESLDFTPGDLFHEMYSFWKVVIKNDGGKITTLEGNSSRVELKTYDTPQSFKESLWVS